ncbi:MAG: carboxypeptidase-like regulatory domain-containing protein [Bacteroidetes bacterium]|nr:carboxypeptidase-like regulatory domain-containing protein [Bacteroidota bacterium]MBV6460014.1 hypothetical protein [Flavobacteriales bacterium]WKZ76342.1 MAG: DUF5686 and carboxypeptidase regulatory-like domain-containing protein [Vicingaceae bacterium]MCL4816264.1 carboxypeptidase-like regulatory domain-containing protein [Flavobacteriales bacterium]NOG95409.1 carboxypeptidase-like regulatory domain-containing protein [Bacteroidota bacterium]
MHLLLINFCFLSVFLLCSKFLASQSLSGIVFDENNQPLSSVNVYIKYTATGTSTNSKGEYFFTLPHTGTYEFIFSSIGYQNKIIEITVRKNENIIKNIWLQPAVVNLNELTVSAKKRDPAYDIIKKCIDEKDKYLNQYRNSVSEVYIRATEEGDLSDKQKVKLEQQKLKQAEKNKKKNNADSLWVADTLHTLENIQTDKKMNITESKLVRYWQEPNSMKEIKTAYKKTGSSYGLFFLTTTDGDFNFYHNILNIERLSETPFISPLSRLTFLTYKFSLEETIKQNEKIIYKIKVWPWKTGDATLKGFLWIEDNSWAIDSLELTMEKGTLLIYDQFTIRQKYNLFNDSIRALTKQEFIYFSKDGKNEYNGKTIVVYSNYKFNREFPKRFFGNELGVTEKDAFKRDSVFWNNERPVPLTREEQIYIAKQDSIYEKVNSKEYQDSVDARFNKVTWGKVLYWGQGYRKRSEKKEIWFGSVGEYVEPFQIGGFRFGPYISYFKKWKSEKYINTNASLNYGFRNEDFKGGLSTTFRYNPYKLSEIRTWQGHLFDVINPYDAFLNLIKRANYFEKTYLGLGHKTELLNGLYFDISGEYTFRRPISGYKFGTVMDEVFTNNVPVDFIAFNSFITTASLSYTINQKYIREPFRKVVLGSKWPTFSVVHRKGISGIFSSAVNFDYLEVLMNQSFKVGTLGTSNYRLSSGKFLNTRQLSFIDFKYHRAGDPFLYSNPMHSYQLLESTMSTIDIYYELHYIHHFNGAFINNIPLIKKTRIQTVMGGGLLYMTDRKYQYAEVYAGVERAFRIARRRFRFGIYGVAAEANQAKPKYGIKFSLEEFNHRENRWRF